MMSDKTIYAHLAQSGCLVFAYDQLGMGSRIYETLQYNGDASSSGGEASGSSSSSSGQSGSGGPVTNAVTSQPVAGQSPGSAEDFVVNVGDRVLFDLDRFDLSPEARTTVENQVIWLKRFPGVTVMIEGHTDERGTREYNLALGERRANSVSDYMIALGVDPNRIKTISYGKERPVDPSSNEDAWSRNRRAVTVVDAGTG